MRAALFLVVVVSCWPLGEAATKTKEPAPIGRHTVNPLKRSTLAPATRRPNPSLRSPRHKVFAAQPPVEKPLSIEALKHNNDYSASLLERVDALRLDARGSRESSDMATALQTGSVLLGPLRLVLFLALMPLRLVLGWLILLGETLVALFKALPQAIALVWRAALLAGMYYQTHDYMHANTCYQYQSAHLLLALPFSMQLAAPSCLACA